MDAIVGPMYGTGWTGVRMVQTNKSCTPATSSLYTRVQAFLTILKELWALNLKLVGFREEFPGKTNDGPGFVATHRPKIEVNKKAIRTALEGK
ncbi:MAG: hypothetical protein Q9161_006009 [Pseudevernia consocians]